MSFSKSSHTIALSSDSSLSAKCRKCGGEWQDSSIRLDDFLGNEDGAFQLGDRDFSLTAKDAVIEQTEDCAVLRACLRKRDGSWQDAAVELDAFISNQDGELCLEIDVFLPQLADGVTDELQALVAKCEASARDLQSSIRNSITEGTASAFSSISYAFQGIEDTQHALRDARVDITHTIQHQAVFINTLFVKSLNEWTKVEDAVASSSQRVKEFQHTQLHASIAEVEQTEGTISAQIKETQRRRARTEEHIESLQKQIDLNEEAQKKAGEQVEAANGRTIGFSIASVILPFIFIPLAVTAAGEREDWGRRRDGFQTKINRAKIAQDTQRQLLQRLEEGIHLAKESKEKCFALRRQTEKLTEDLKHFESGIHELKKSLTTFSLTLRQAETSAVTAFQYSQTLEEGRTILNDALRLKSELSERHKLQRLLEI
ncbi:cyanovirin-n [Diplodia corticola]|uniref:Cyanovirin-n n=1 Tax=Diplodia corticola TaxID=236234 RepID=A0A1J9RN43_9PEZI|nr:cyanovirin-n [Diplodia corticola]OJD33979.1 cyanovirin-n [Diplodia corticola]